MPATTEANPELQVMPAITTADTLFGATTNV